MEKLNNPRSLVAGLFSLGKTARLLPAAACLLGLSGLSAPTNATPVQDQSSSYVSPVDEELTIRKISVLPVSDNVEGIYARPIENQIAQLAKSSHRWDFVESNIAGNLPSLIELEESPAEFLRVTKTIEADAVLAATASRGPKGLSIRLDLFMKKDGRVISQEILRDHPRFELPEIKERVAELYQKTLERIPYDGLLLSRQNNRVTINLGKSDGLTKDQMVTVIQVIGVTRHPKFNFLLSSDKEILGRIKILKVDETLSFGAIVSEREKGAVRKYAKVSGLSQVNYPEPARLEEGTASTEIHDRADANLIFGKEPKEWLPVRPPAYGEVRVNLGLGVYHSAVNLGNAVGSLEAQSYVYPSINLSGEIWLTPQWFVKGLMARGVLATANPRANSTPKTINQSLQRYSLEGGYNFLLRDDFFGPKMYLTAGFSNYRMYSDAASPEVFQTTIYSGAMIGFGGLFPINDFRTWYLGGKMNLYLFPSFNEAPHASGASASSTVTEFSTFIEKKIAENLRATGGVDFSLYSSTITGQGTRTGPSGLESAISASEVHSVINGGLSYMF